MPHTPSPDDNHAEDADQVPDQAFSPGEKAGVILSWAALLYCLGLALVLYLIRHLRTILD